MSYEDQDKAYRALQISLLREYKRENHESAQLYFNFHMKAKIVFMARAVSSENFVQGKP